jgi:hypothetical protein
VLNPFGFSPTGFLYRIRETELDSHRSPLGELKVVLAVRANILIDLGLIGLDLSATMRIEPQARQEPQGQRRRSPEMKPSLEPIELIQSTIDCFSTRSLTFKYWI